MAKRLGLMDGGIAGLKAPADCDGEGRPIILLLTDGLMRAHTRAKLNVRPGDRARSIAVTIERLR